MHEAISRLGRFLLLPDSSEAVFSGRILPYNTETFKRIQVLQLTQDVAPATRAATAPLLSEDRGRRLDDAEEKGILQAQRSQWP